MTEGQIEECKRLHPPKEWPKDWRKFITVPNGENSVIINTLPNEFPKDLNFKYYIDKVKEEIANIEIVSKPITTYNKIELF
jgi:hypothetical protein